MRLVRRLKTNAERQCQKPESYNHRVYLTFLLSRNAFACVKSSIVSKKTLLNFRAKNLDNLAGERTQRDREDLKMRDLQM